MAERKDAHDMDFSSVVHVSVIAKSIAIESDVVCTARHTDNVAVEHMEKSKLNIFHTNVC